LPPSPPNGFIGDQNGQTIAVTDTVVVPSSEHVAEIVGRQGRTIYTHTLCKKTTTRDRLFNKFVLQVTCINQYFAYI
jgi:hypothetical protein